jgi:hypothetical protein
MVLILKYEKKVGGYAPDRKIFFSVLKEKSFAALRFAHKNISSSNSDIKSLLGKKNIFFHSIK